VGLTLPVGWSEGGPQMLPEELNRYTLVAADLI